MKYNRLLTGVLESDDTSQMLRGVAHRRIGGERFVREIVLPICVHHRLHQQVACVQAAHIVVAGSLVEQHGGLPFVSKGRGTCQMDE